MLTAKAVNQAKDNGKNSCKQAATTRLKLIREDEKKINKISEAMSASQLRRCSFRRFNGRGSSAPYSSRRELLIVRGKRGRAGGERDATGQRQWLFPGKKATKTTNENSHTHNSGQ